MSAEFGSHADNPLYWRNSPATERYLGIDTPKPGFEGAVQRFLRELTDACAGPLVYREAVRLGHDFVYGRKSLAEVYREIDQKEARGMFEKGELRRAFHSPYTSPNWL